MLLSFRNFLNALFVNSVPSSVHSFFGFLDVNRDLKALIISLDDLDFKGIEWAYLENKSITMMR